MFCPNCGDIRETVESIPEKKNANLYRCTVCGHVFIFITCPHLDKKYEKPLREGFMDNTRGGRR